MTYILHKASRTLLLAEIFRFLEASILPKGIKQAEPTKSKRELTLRLDPDSNIDSIQDKKPCRNRIRSQMKLLKSSACKI